MVTFLVGWCDDGWDGGSLTNGGMKGCDVECCTTFSSSVVVCMGREGFDDYHLLVENGPTRRLSGGRWLEDSWKERQ